MNQLQRDWLNKNHRKLMANIAPKEVADFLYQQECLTLDDLERIGMPSLTTADKCRILLEKLPQRNRNGLKALVIALKESSPWILDELGPIPMDTDTEKVSRPIEKIDNSVFVRLTRNSEVLRDWKHLARSLGLTDVDVLVIGNENERDLREATHQMLVKWKSKFGRKATPQTLISALRECELTAMADELEGR